MNIQARQLGISDIKQMNYEACAAGSTNTFCKFCKNRRQQLDGICEEMKKLIIGGSFNSVQILISDEIVDEIRMVFLRNGWNS
jgi:hypothetical protein